MVVFYPIALSCYWQSDQYSYKIFVVSCKRKYVLGKHTTKDPFHSAIISGLSSSENFQWPTEHYFLLFPDNTFLLDGNFLDFQARKDLSTAGT